jgi:hypothetical protein
MIGKLISYGLIGALAVSLVGGGAYILTRPDTEAAVRSGQANSQDGNGQAVGDTDRKGNPDSEWPGGGQGAGPSEGAVEKPVSSTGGKGQGNAGGSAVLTLSTEGAAGVSALLEEEKLARDVYLSLYQQWGYAAFENISASEQSHMDALLSVMERAGITDPTATYGVGEFPTPAVQELYDRFTAEGEQSLAAALRTGAAIEEMDILDIERLQSGTDNPELLRVLESLRQGSINHLRAYSSAYEKETGFAYTPQYMDQGTYDLLMSAEMQGNRGGGGQGGPKGNGGA